MAVFAGSDDDAAAGSVVASTGAAYLTRTTSAPEFPLVNPTHIERRRKALTIRELSELLTISDEQIRVLATKGHILSYRIGEAIRLDPFAVAKWLRGQRM